MKTRTLAMSQAAKIGGNQRDRRRQVRKRRSGGSVPGRARELAGGAGPGRGGGAPPRRRLSAVRKRTFEHNGFREQVKRESSAGHYVTFRHDALGRVTIRDDRLGVSVTLDGRASWTYDTAPHGLAVKASPARDGGYTKPFAPQNWVVQQWVPSNLQQWSVASL